MVQRSRGEKMGEKGESVWWLAVDFGTTYTSAAMLSVEGRVEVLEVDGVRRMPSTVALLADELVVGNPADAQGTMFPGATERNPKRLLGLRSHLALDGRAIPTVDAVAAVLTTVLDEAMRRHNGVPPTGALLTHPARWPQARLDTLVEAAEQAGIAEAQLMPEPVAAALHFATDNVAPGDHVAVYDLGGGTFDTAVLRRTVGGFELAGPPGGDDRLGGEDFDHRLANFMIAHLAGDEPDMAARLTESEDAEWTTAAAQVLRVARDAKEALSRQTTYRALLPAPINHEVRITRPEFEALIRADVQRSIDEFTHTIERAGLEPTELAARYLTGGSSRIPLINRLLTEAFDETPDTYDDPKVAVAIGGAKAMQLPPPTLIGPPPDPATIISTAAATIPQQMDPPQELTSEPDPAPPSPDSEPGPPLIERIGQRRLLLAGAAACLLVVLGLAYSLGGGDDELGWSLSDGTVQFDPAETSQGGMVERIWAPEGEELVGQIVIDNPTDESITVRHVEWIPKSIAGHVDDLAFSVDPDEVIDPDPIVAWSVDLDPQELVHITYTATVGDDFDIEAAAEEWSAAQDQLEAGESAAASDGGSGDDTGGDDGDGSEDGDNESNGDDDAEAQSDDGTAEGEDDADIEGDDGDDTPVGEICPPNLEDCEDEEEPVDPPVDPTPQEPTTPEPQEPTTPDPQEPTLPDLSVFISGPSSLQAGQSGEFGAGVSGNSGSWSIAWSFGDSSSASTQTVNHSWSSAGTYTVRATVTDGSGRSATATKTVTVTQEPLTVSMSGPSSLQAGQSGTYDVDVDGNDGGWTISWTWGDSSTSVIRPVGHTWSAAGTYTVRATVTDSGGRSATATKTVTVTQEPLTVSMSGPSSLQAGQSGTYDVDVDGNDGGWTINWSWGDGSTSVVRPVGHTWSTPGTYTVTATVTDGAERSATATKTVTVTQEPLTVSMSGPTSLNVGQSGTYDVDVDGNDGGWTILWDWDNGNTSVFRPVGYWWSSAGTYTVTATVTDSADRSATATKIVTVS